MIKYLSIFVRAWESLAGNEATFLHPKPILTPPSTKCGTVLETIQTHHFLKDKLLSRVWLHERLDPNTLCEIPFSSVLWSLVGDV